MICCSVEVWWKDEGSPDHEYTRYSVFETEQDYKSYNLSPADFGVPNSASWRFGVRRIDFSDLPGWAQERVSDNGIPNGVIPFAVGEAFCEKLLERTELEFLRGMADALTGGGAR